MEESDGEIINLYKDEIRNLEGTLEKLEESLFESIGSFEPPEVEQTVRVSIFPKNGLEAAISVGHLAEFYRNYFQHNSEYSLYICLGNKCIYQTSLSYFKIFIT